MSLRDRLFKPRWQHRDPEVRARSVANDNDAGLRRQLNQIARGDEAATVRAAALARINDLDVILQLALSDADEGVRGAARRMALPLLLKQPSAHTQAPRLIREWQDQSVMETVAAKAQDADLRRMALEYCRGQGFLGRRAIDDDNAANRALAMERISQASTLEKVANALRRSDKKLYRRTLERLREITGDRHIGAAEIQHKLCARTELLARGEGVKQLDLQVAELRQAWDASGEPEAALARRFNGAIAILQSALDGPSEGPDTDADAQIETSAATTEDISGESKTTTDESPVVATASGQNEADADGQVKNTPSDSTSSETQSAAPEKAAPNPIFIELLENLGRLRQSAANDKLPRGALKRWRQHWDKAWQELHRPDSTHADEQRLAAQAKEWTHDIEQKLAASNARREEQRAKLEQHIEQLARAVEAGHLADATRIEQTCQSILKQNKGARPPRQWRGLQEQIAEMRRWQRWSNNQHRHQLIEDMQALAETDLHPDAIMEKVRAARQDWQHLDHQEKSCGLPGGHRAWSHFNAACQQVTKTAQPFLEKRHQVREQRAETLRRIISASASLLAQENTDSKQLLGQRRQLTGALRELGGVPHKERTTLASELRQHLTRVDARLKEIEQTVVAAKQKLIQQAAALGDSEVLGQAIRDAKQLQQEWQQSGHIRRGREQKLWKEFRGHIDPLFEKLSSANEERHHQQQEQREHWRQLCEEGQALLQQDMDSETLAKAWAALQQRWQDAQVNDKALDEQWSAVGAHVRERLNTAATAAARAATEKHWVDVRNKQQWAVQRLANENAEPPTGLESWSELGQAELNQRLDENTRQAMQVCIAMEYLAGLDSPDAQRQQRMEYQVERLAARLGQGETTPSPGEELETLEARWFASIPVQSSAYGELEERFRKAWDVIIKTI